MLNIKIIQQNAIIWYSWNVIPYGISCIIHCISPFKSHQLLTWLKDKKTLLAAKKTLRFFCSQKLKLFPHELQGSLIQPSLGLNFCGTKNAISSIMCSNLTAFTIREWVLNSSKWQNTSSLVPVINVSIYLPKRQRDIILGRNEQRSISAYPRIMLMDSYQLTEITVILFRGINYITWVNSVSRLILSINNTAMVWYLAIIKPQWGSDFWQRVAG